MAKGALLYATTFAKSVCEGHPIQGFMASDKANFIQKVIKRRERLDANTLLLQKILRLCAAYFTS